MKLILISLISVALVLTAGIEAFGQTVERQVEAIRKIYSETNGLIAEMQKAPELSSVFSVELAVNKFSVPYPAVGTYQATAIFYYTYGDRERNPHPDRLLMVRTVTKRSAFEQTGEYYFGKDGDLVFVFISAPGTEAEETRMYFGAGRMIKMVTDGKEAELRSKAAVAASKAARTESERLAGIFKSSLAIET